MGKPVLFSNGERVRFPSPTKSLRAPRIRRSMVSGHAHDHQANEQHGGHCHLQLSKNSTGPLILPMMMYIIFNALVCGSTGGGTLQRLRRIQRLIAVSSCLILPGSRLVLLATAYCCLLPLLLLMLETSSLILGNAQKS